MSSDQHASPNEPDPAVAAAAPPRLWRFQFSLATLLWLTTVVACLAAVGAMYQKLRARTAEAKAEVERAKGELHTVWMEVQKYRGEMGYLDIADPTRLYAHAFRPTGNYKFSWRIYVPKRPVLRLCTSHKAIPWEEYPRPEGRMPILEPGEHIIHVSAEPGRDGKWRSYVQVDNNFGEESEMVPLENSHASIQTTLSDERFASPNSPLVLLRVRKLMQLPGSPPDSNARRSCDGLMIWIEEAK
jgi:hypothetical protein